MATNRIVLKQGLWVLAICVLLCQWGAEAQTSPTTTDPATGTETADTTTGTGTAGSETAAKTDPATGSETAATATASTTGTNFPGWVIALLVMASFLVLLLLGSTCFMFLICCRRRNDCERPTPNSQFGYCN